MSQYTESTQERSFHLSGNHFQKKIDPNLLFVDAHVVRGEWRWIRGRVFNDLHDLQGSAGDLSDTSAPLWNLSKLRNFLKHLPSCSFSIVVLVFEAMMESTIKVQYSQTLLLAIWGSLWLFYLENHLRTPQTPPTLSHTMIVCSGLHSVIMFRNHRGQ